jgi:hypothetical protein
VFSSSTSLLLFKQSSQFSVTTGNTTLARSTESQDRTKFDSTYNSVS